MAGGKSSLNNFASKCVFLKFCSLLGLWHAQLHPPRLLPARSHCQGGDANRGQHKKLSQKVQIRLNNFQYALTFSLGFISSLLTSLFLALYGSSLNPAFVLVCGASLQCTSGGVFFGLLLVFKTTACFATNKILIIFQPQLKDLSAFLATSYTLRIVFGVGDSFTFISVYALALSAIPERQVSIVQKYKTFLNICYDQFGEQLSF